MLNVVVLNGGRGAATVIPALLRRPGLKLTSVVNAYDDGKSTGEIRRFFGMLGPSDLRKVQSLMLPEQDAEIVQALFDHRFPDGIAHDAALADIAAFCDGGERVGGIGPVPEHIAFSLRVFLRQFAAALALNEKVAGRRFPFGDCALMNCVYAGAYLASGRDMEAATATIGQLFRLRGVVLPNSGDDRWLLAERENGEILTCEADIVELRSNERISRLFLVEEPVDPAALARLSTSDQARYLASRHKPVHASTGVRLALEQADIVIYAAGTQHSSLFPTYMSGGLAASIAGNTGALKVFVTNIGADYETPQYRASDFLAGAERFLRLSDNRHYAAQDLFSLVLINSSRIKPDESYVDYDADAFAGHPVPRVVADLESRAAPGKHDGERVVQTILDHHEAASRRALGPADD